jgi:hypothetical protein
MHWRLLILIGAPIVLIAGAIGFMRFESSRGREDLLAPEMIAWVVDSRPVQIRSSREVANEIESFNIEIQFEGAAPYLITFEIDHDMYGGGFVGGLDLDKDGEVELLLATRRGPEASRLVALESNRIVERSFDQLPAGVWLPVKARLDRVAPSPYGTIAALLGAVWLVIGLLSYLFIGLRALFGRPQSRGPKKSA